MNPLRALEGVVVPLFREHALVMGSVLEELRAIRELLAEWLEAADGE